ncbi:D-lactaldehyde dehydrogenase [Pilatotrama ljubarskyi]|nr:D-lactaldehyde dehydrogenase [Pilatotrama ljubarskyi]
MPTISPPAKVLVTGANGFIGLWVVHELLARGYTVHGAVRSEGKAQALAEHIARKFPEAKERFKSFTVADITEPGAFDEAIKGADGVVHTASPVTSSLDDPEAYIQPAVQGTIGILKSALRSEVKRVVITASIAGIASSTIALPRVYTEADWNDAAVKVIEEEGRNAPGQIKYDASKTLAERAAWGFMTQHDNEARFDLCMINPSWVFGPLADDTLPSPAAMSATPLYLYNMLFTTPPPAERTPKCLNYVDVRDVTEMLIKALEVQEAGGQRIISNSQLVTWDDWLLAAEQLKLLPGLQKLDASSAETAPPYPFFANDKAERIFGLKLRKVPDTLKDVVKDFRARGWLKHLERSAA